MTLFERIQVKKAELDARLSQLEADINAVSGAIQLCDQLISEFSQSQNLQSTQEDQILPSAQQTLENVKE